MKTGKRNIYWDSACWIAWLNGEGTDIWPIDVIDGLQDVVNEVETNQANLFTSTIMRMEVPIDRLDDAQKDIFNKILRRSNVLQIDPTPKIIDRARDIIEFHRNQKPSRVIQHEDSIHLATAIIYGAHEFQTTDGLQKEGSKRRKLLALNGNVGGHILSVVPPYRRSNPPAELVVIEGPLFSKDLPDGEVLTQNEKSIKKTQDANRVRGSHNGFAGDEAGTSKEH